MADICPCTVRQSSELEAPDCSSFVRVLSLASTKRHGLKTKVSTRADKKFGRLERRFYLSS